MSIQQTFYGVDGVTKNYTQTKYIANKQHCGVLMKRIDDDTWDSLPVSNFDLQDNTIKLVSAISGLVYNQIEIRVVDTADELGTDASAISIVAGISNEIIIVSGIPDEIVTVAGIEADVTKTAVIDTDVTTVAGIDSDVTEVAGIAGDVTAVNTEPLKQSILDASTNAANAAQSASDASDSADASEASATSASGSAGSASDSETASGVSASNASDSEDAAEAAAIAADLSAQSIDTENISATSVITNGAIQSGALALPTEEVTGSIPILYTGNGASQDVTTPMQIANDNGDGTTLAVDWAAGAYIVGEIVIDNSSDGDARAYRCIKDIDSTYSPIKSLREHSSVYWVLETNQYGGRFWFKNRDVAGNHLLFDSIRREENLVQSDVTKQPNFTNKHKFR